jgi:hypothetical protein
VSRPRNALDRANLSLIEIARQAVSRSSDAERFGETFRFSLQRTIQFSRGLLRSLLEIAREKTTHMKNVSSLCRLIPHHARMVLAGFFALSMGLASFAAPETLAIDHSAQIKPVDQGKADLCWLAGAAMMESSKAGVAVSMSKLAQNLGEPFLSYFNNKAALPFADLEVFQQKLSFRQAGFQSFRISWWADRLRAGPLWVIGFDGGSSAHVRVLVGISGPSDEPENITVTYVDPRGGQKKKEKFTAFIAFYEAIAEGAGTLPPQILYY